MYQSEVEKNIIKERRKKFNKVIGSQLKELGFKKKGSSYYRIVLDDILQIASYGCPSENNYEICFDFIPLYGNYLFLKLGYIKSLNELSGIYLLNTKNKKCVQTFEEQMELFISEIIPVFENVKSTDTLMDYCRKNKNTVRSQLYVEIKSGDFTTAISRIINLYNNRMKFELKKYNNGFYSNEEYEGRVNDWKNFYSQEIELMKAMRIKNTDEIDRILDSNVKCNKLILESKLKLDLSN